MKISSRQGFPRRLVYNPSSLFPSNSQGIILPGSSQEAFIFGHPGFTYPQQDNSSAYMRIHLHSYHITYIASCIMTLHTTNPLPFQVRSVDRQRSSSEIHPGIVQMWPGHSDILILIPDSLRCSFTRTHHQETLHRFLSNFKTSENSLRILPNNGC